MMSGLGGMRPPTGGGGSGLGGFSMPNLAGSSPGHRGATTTQRPHWSATRWCRVDRWANSTGLHATSPRDHLGSPPAWLSPDQAIAMISTGLQESKLDPHRFGDGDIWLWESHFQQDRLRWAARPEPEYRILEPSRR